MSTIEVFAIAASTFSMFLALFAIWLAFQQRRESQSNYENTKNVLGEIEKVMEKTELLVSENFQSLLKSTVEQQRELLESLKPKPTVEEKYADLMIKLGSDEPEKLERLADAIIKVTQSQAQTQQSSSDAWSQFIAAAIQAQQNRD